MNSDIKLDADGDGWVTVETDVLKASSSDFMLDCPPRRKRDNAFRRALVHNEKDGLTVNFAGDYPDGVTVNGALAVTGDLKAQDAAFETVRAGRLRLQAVDSAGNALPRTGKLGEIILLRNTDLDPARLLPDVSLWVCLGKQIGLDADGVYWQQISVGEPVAGTLG